MQQVHRKPQARDLDDHVHVCRATRERRQRPVGAGLAVMRLSARQRQHGVGIRLQPRGRSARERQPERQDRECRGVLELPHLHRQPLYHPVMQRGRRFAHQHGGQSHGRRAGQLHDPAAGKRGAAAIDCAQPGQGRAAAGPLCPRRTRGACPAAPRNSTGTSCDAGILSRHAAGSNDARQRRPRRLSSASYRPAGSIIAHHRSAA